MSFTGVILAIFIMVQLNKLDDLERAEAARRHRERMGK